MHKKTEKINGTHSAILHNLYLRLILSPLPHLSFPSPPSLTLYVAGDGKARQGRKFRYTCIHSMQVHSKVDTLARTSFCLFLSCPLPVLMRNNSQCVVRSITFSHSTLYRRSHDHPFLRSADIVTIRRGVRRKGVRRQSV